MLLLTLPAPGIDAAETVSGLPPAPKWKRGAAQRAPDGQIELNPDAADPLANLTGGHHRTGIGSGFFVARGGSVVTNHHVIARSNLITVETPWNTAGMAKLVASDPVRGLALLKTDVTSPAEVAFATRGHLRTGESLTVAGYPTRKLPPLSPQITRATHTGAFARAHPV